MPSERAENWAVGILMGWLTIPPTLLIILCLILESRVESRLAARPAPSTKQVYQHEREYDALRAQVKKWDETRLHQELLKEDQAQLKDMNDPEPLIRKAIIAEGLTRFDTGQTNRWKRAETHYKDALDLLHMGAMPKPDQTMHRIALVNLYIGQALAVQNLHDGAKVYFQEAAKHPDVKGRAEDALKKRSR